MKNKLLYLIIFMVFITNRAFPQSEFRVSAGFGGYFTSDFGGGVENTNLGRLFSHIKTPYFGGGAFVFLDATFVELNFGGFMIKGEWEEFFLLYGPGGVYPATYKFNSLGIGLDIGLLGKYPFAVSEKITVFPFLGITYRAILALAEEGYKIYDPDEYNTLWFNFGGGLDYSITDNIYLRTGILYGIRLINEFERKTIERLNTSSWGDDVINNILGHGLEIKLAVGFRF